MAKGGRVAVEKLDMDMECICVYIKSYIETDDEAHFHATAD